MKMLVLGAGLQGCACAYDLLQNPAVDPGDAWPICSRTASAVPRRARPGGAPPPVRLDVTDATAVRAVMTRPRRRHERHPLLLQRADGPARGRGRVPLLPTSAATPRSSSSRRSCTTRRGRRASSVMPDCGLAPGMVNILAAEGIRPVDAGRARCRIYVGGLPQHPEPPLNYQIVYSLEGALDYYTTPSWVLRGGKPTQVDALSSSSTWTSRSRWARSRRSTPAAASAPCRSPTRARST